MRLGGALALALACTLAPGLATARAAAPELAAYADYARGAAGQRLLAVAREALWAGSSTRDSLRAGAPDWPAAPRPLFVTLVRGHATRACLGSDEPRGTLTETVRDVALRLLTGDRRHPPLRADELDSLELRVAFASEPVGVSDPYALDPMRTGLRIEGPQGAVAFLPGEARTVRWALAEARRIGVLAGGADARFSRFEVVVLSGPAAAGHTGRPVVDRAEVPR